MSPLTNQQSLDVTVDGTTKVSEALREYVPRLTERIRNTYRTLDAIAYCESPYTADTYPTAVAAIVEFRVLCDHADKFTDAHKSNKEITEQLLRPLWNEVEDLKVPAETRFALISEWFGNAVVTPIAKSP